MSLSDRAPASIFLRVERMLDDLGRRFDVALTCGPALDTADADGKRTHLWRLIVGNPHGAEQCAYTGTDPAALIRAAYAGAPSGRVL